MQNKYQYVCKPSANGGYRVTVKPTDNQKETNERLVLVAEMCILNKLADDFSIRLVNLPVVKEKSSAFSKSIGHRFNDIRRKMCRFVGGERKFESFETNICEIIDKSENNVEWLEKNVKSELVGKIKWQYIETVMLSGIVGGLVEILILLHKSLYNKKCEEYEEIKGIVNKIETTSGENLVNKGVMPDYTRIYDNLGLFFKNIRKKSEEFVEKAKKERELSCLKETKTA